MSATVQAYHERSKHRLQRYAAGPETLDWEAQHDPFRRWAGAPVVTLPLVADTLPARWGELPGAVPPAAMNVRSVAALFELSFGLTAWKQQGPDRWALRANPSSGNLHPSEAYLCAQGLADVADGLHHYAPRDHALEHRAAPAVIRAVAGPRLWVGLSSNHWREAWKYGERAFRYCQLDAGHALGALRYAAATLGWQARPVVGMGDAPLAALLGLDRRADFDNAEAEWPEWLLQVGPALPAPADRPAVWAEPVAWHGQANRLDARPMYRWPVIGEVAAATRMPAALPPRAACDAPTTGAASRPVPAAALGALPAATLIRGRRSAQQFDRRATLPAPAFFRMLAALLPDAGLPWDAWPHPPQVHAVLYVHRVDGLAPGACVLPRSAPGAALLAAGLHLAGAWQPVPEAPAALPLQRLAGHPGLAGTLRTLSCHQAIASDACFAVSLVAEFDALNAGEPWRYRECLQEAGLIGQVLYLQAEAEGFRGTGIGCYFDDAVHELLGLSGTRLQVLYHFTVGVPVADLRVGLEAPYAHRPTSASMPAVTQERP